MSLTFLRFLAALQKNDETIWVSDAWNAGSKNDCTRLRRICERHLLSCEIKHQELGQQAACAS